MENLSKSYSKLFTYCKQKHVLKMWYCLEMDLVANKVSRTKYCYMFSLADDKTAFYELLIQRQDVINSLERIIEIVRSLWPSDYPYSFKKIRATLLTKIEDKDEN